MCVNSSQSKNPKPAFLWCYVPPMNDQEFLEYQQPTSRGKMHHSNHDYQLTPRRICIFLLHLYHVNLDTFLKEVHDANNSYVQLLWSKSKKENSETHDQE